MSNAINFMISDCVITSEIESFQNIVVSKNEQVEELQSILEIKEERVKELESQIHIFPNFLPG